MVQQVLAAAPAQAIPASELLIRAKLGVQPLISGGLLKSF